MEPKGVAMGRCALYGHYNSMFPTLKVSVPGDESTVLITYADFGCVQAEWKTLVTPQPEGIEG